MVQDAGALPLPRHAFLRRGVSAEVGLLKPEPETCRLCLARNGLAAEPCVFVDDSAENVEAASALGIDAIRLTNPPAPRRAQAARGLPVRGRRLSLGRR